MSYNDDNSCEAKKNGIKIGNIDFFPLHHKTALYIKDTQLKFFKKLNGI